MRVRVFAILALAVCAAAAAPAVLADESVTFTNGASMVIVSHEYEAKTGMIRFDLGAGSSIKFPASMIDSITVSGKSVFSGSNIAVPNQTVAVDRTSSAPTYTVGASAAAPGESVNSPRVHSASERRRQLLDPEAQLMAAQQPPDMNPGTAVNGPAGQRLRMMGRPRDRAADDPAGTTPTANGNFTVTPNASPAKRVFGEIGPRGSSAAAPTAPPPSPPAETQPPPSDGETQEPPPDDSGPGR